MHGRTVPTYAYDQFGNNVSIVDGENTTTKTYDRFGNLLTSVSRPRQGSPPTYDADDRLSPRPIPKVTTINAYDAVGNRISADLMKMGTPSPRSSTATTC